MRAYVTFLSPGAGPRGWFLTSVGDTVLAGPFSSEGEAFRHALTTGSRSEMCEPARRRRSGRRSARNRSEHVNQ